MGVGHKSVAIEQEILGIVRERRWVKIGEISDRVLAREYGISERQVWHRGDLYGEKRSLSVRIRNRLNELEREGVLKRHSRRVWQVIVDYSELHENIVDYSEGGAKDVV